MTVRVQSAAFDYGVECARFAASVSHSGAVVTFLGVVRDNGGSLSAMEIEHYPGMTERALSQIETDATERWALEDTLILHRYGCLKPGESIMMVATASRHRADAFAAADFLMDFLKSRAPFWKKEITQDSASWVDAKDTDEAALTRWDQPEQS